MSLPTVPSRREPDIQLILHENPHTLPPTFMDGPADLVVEVVSPESETRDYAEKFHQYEAGGVPEYWIIDPIKLQALFYLRNVDGAYEFQHAGETYEAPRLARPQAANCYAVAAASPRSHRHRRDGTNDAERGVKRADGCLARA